MVTPRDDVGIDPENTRHDPDFARRGVAVMRRWERWHSGAKFYRPKIARNCRDPTQFVVAELRKKASAFCAIRLPRELSTLLKVNERKLSAMAG